MEESRQIRGGELLPGDLISGLGLELEVVNKTTDVPDHPDEIDVYLRNGGLPIRFKRIALFTLIRRTAT